MSTRQTTGEVLVWAVAFLSSIVLGASVYQRLAIIPEWGSNLPESLITYFRGTQAAVAMGRFWSSPILPLTGLLLIAALIINWPDRSRRKWLSAAAIAFFAALIWTIVWFVPQGVIPLMARGGEGMTAAEITARASAWIFWDWARMALTAAAYLFVLKVLTIRPAHVR